MESGPAAGALVAAHLGAADGGAHVLAFDMGGTTAKLSVVDDGKPTVAYHFEAAREKRFIEGSGMPVRISTLELIEIGAGGGSIAHLDEIGLLKVGPRSAGSEPGPAATAAAAALPTVTDADFLLGYLNPDYFAGGTMRIDVAAISRALRPLATEAGLSEIDLAWGIHDVVNENMANAARVHIAEHGKDPRRYALLSTGGAGPVHAYYVAKKLGLSRLIAPRGAGVASALGLLIAPARIDRVATVAREMDAIDWPDLEATFQRLEADARKRAGGNTGRQCAPPHRPSRRHSLCRPGIGTRRRASRRALYSGDARSADAGLPEELHGELHAHAADATGRDHQRARGRDRRSGGQCAGDDGPTAHCWSCDQGAASRLFPGIPRLSRNHGLRPRGAGRGHRAAGPAIIEEPESTLVVGPGGRCEVLPSGNIIVTIG